MSGTRSGDHRVRAFMVRLPSDAGYWTVLDEDLAVVPAADAFLRQLRFGHDGAESTTKAYAGSIALFLRWCARTGRDWQAGAAQLGLFMTWLVHAGPQASGTGARPGAAVLTGPGSAPARSARRVNGVLAAVRGMVVHAVTEGTAPGHLVRLLFEVADDADLPAGARAEDGSTGWRVRARHRLHEPECPVDRAADGDIVAVLGGCCSARDRLIVLLMARAGLRRGGVQAFDSWEFERMTVPAAASGDFVVVNMFRAPLGAPMRLDAVNDLVAAAAQRAGVAGLRPHQMRHAFASNVLDAGGALEAAQDLLGHASITSTQVYAHPDPARLRAAVDAVPSPRARTGVRS